MRLHLEALEERALLSVAASFSGGILNLFGDPGAAHNVLVRPTANVAGSVDIVADGVTTAFTGATRINYQNLGTRGDVFTNRTTIAGTINSAGPAQVYTIAPGSTVIVGDANSTLQVTGGNSIITAGNGNDSIYGGPGDRITVGSGQDVIYDILPGNQSVSVAAHQGVDHLFVGPQSTLSGALSQDHVAKFFTAAPLGSGTLAQLGSTIYFAGNNNGDTLYLLGSSQLLVAVYNLNDGTGFHIQAFTGVNQIAAFGGNGNDTFVNSSTVDDAMYGAGGSNLLYGGFGQLDLEKAGGAAATGSVAVGRSAVANDLNGSGLTNTSNTLIFANPSAANIARTNSPTDTVLNLGGGVLMSLYPDQVAAAFLPPFVPA